MSDGDGQYESESDKDKGLGGNFSYKLNAFTCYQCEKDGKNFQTNFKTDYQQHWVKSGHLGSCYPGIANSRFRKTRMESSGQRMGDLVKS